MVSLRLRCRAGGCNLWLGDMGNGPVLKFRVPDRRDAHLQRVRVLEVAGDDHRLLDPEAYWAAVAN